ncbi:hypothetical protein CJU89_0599 [Yarrowia sp. B02]|nr:hypothetical protein CJU89_0599 [Yarrowia sp. B02]
MAPIVTFIHYNESPIANRTRMFLNFKKIPYVSLLQRLVMPRPDLQKLGINYRRIPLCAIGSDVIVESSLIMSELEDHFFPAPEYFNANLITEGVFKTTNDQVAMARFGLAVINLFPPEFSAAAMPAFAKDRADYLSAEIGKDVDPAIKTQAKIEMQQLADTIENFHLRDGRDFLLGDKFSAADGEYAWIPLFLIFIGGLEQAGVTPEVFPKFFAWIDRVQSVAEDLQSSNPNVTEEPHNEAVARIIKGGNAGDFPLSEKLVHDENNILGVKKGEVVSVVPLDTGKNHPTKGTVFGVNRYKIVIEVPSPGSPKEGIESGKVRVHFPLKGYRVQKESKL